MKNLVRFIKYYKMMINGGDCYKKVVLSFLTIFVLAGLLASTLALAEEEKVKVNLNEVHDSCWSKLTPTQLTQQKVVAPESWVEGCFESSDQEKDEEPDVDSLNNIDKLGAGKYRLEGVIISFKTEEGMFPEDWQKDSVNTKAFRLDRSLYDFSLDVLIEAFSKYPAGLIKENLDKIYVLGELQFFGLEYGGTYSYPKQAVYLQNDNYKEDNLERIFHEEFSSILLSNQRVEKTLLQAKWEEVTPEGFSYTGISREVFTRGEASEEYDRSLLKKGFINQYAQSNFENDFNAIAKKIFCPDSRFWGVVENYPKIKRKVELLISFYNELDSKFTEEYFRKLN